MENIKDSETVGIMTREEKDKILGFDSAPHEKTNPCQPLTGWIGGKQKLAKTIIAEIDKIDHSLYAEPFLGMGGVYLRRTKRPSAEVINDINNNIINLFRIVKFHPEALIKELSDEIPSRTMFDYYLGANGSQYYTDIQRASMWLYVFKNSFFGRGKTFGADTQRGSRFNIELLKDRIKKIHERISKGVVIECLNYDKFIKKYDREYTLFYLDPPYFGFEDDYGKDIFSPEDFDALATLLADIKGKFLLSLNDVPETRELFKDFYIKEVETTYLNHKKYSELLISNQAME